MLNHLSMQPSNPPENPAIPTARLRWVAWLAWCASRLIMATSIFNSDVIIYFNNVQQQGVFAEYGPLANLIIWMPAWVSPTVDPIHYLLGYKTLALMVDGGIFAALQRRATLPVVGLYLAASTAMSTFWLDRLDIFVAGFLLLALRPGPQAFGPAVAAASLIKFPYLGLLAVPLLARRDRATGQAVVGGVVALGAGLLLGALVLGTRSTLTPWAYHGGRTLQVESLLGSLLMAFNAPLELQLTTAVDHGAFHIHGAHEDAIQFAGRLLFVAGVGFTALRLWKIPVPLPHALTVAVVAYTVFNPLGSPQYGIPVLALAAATLPWRDAPTRLTWLLLALYGLLAGLGFSRWDVPAQVQPWLWATRSGLLLVVWARLVMDPGALQGPDGPGFVDGAATPGTTTGPSST